MPPRYAHEQTRSRQDRRLSRLRNRLAVFSTLGFAALFGLAASHSVGATKHGASRLVRRPAGSSPSAHAGYFDEQADSYAFGDPPSAQVQANQAPAAQAAQAPPPPAPQPPLQSPPVAQTSVS